MYRIVYTKQAAKDVKNIKVPGLENKAKALIEIVREDPFRNPPPYESVLYKLS